MATHTCYIYLALSLAQLAFPKRRQSAPATLRSLPNTSHHEAQGHLS